MLKSLSLYLSLFLLQGGSDLIINSYGPVTKANCKKRWLFFQDTKKVKAEEVIGLVGRGAQSLL